MNALNPKITALKARPIMAPLARPISTAKTTIPLAPLVIIDLETDLGLIGSSYIFTYTPLTLKAVIALLEELEALLVGQSADPESIYRQFEEQFRLLGRQGLLGMALSGIDMALWDLKGKQFDIPTCALFGSKPRPIEAYDSHGFVKADRDEKRILESLEMGFKAIKIKAGAPSVEEDVYVVRGIRNIIGPDIRLMVDFNQSLSAVEAAYRARKLEEFDIFWIEEPVPSEDHEGHRSVRENCSIPVQTGENWWFPMDAQHSISAKASDHAMLDIMKIGGFTGWQRAAAVVNAASLPVSSHLFVEASAHALQATSSICYLEYLDLTSTIVQNPYEIVDGTITPKGPGLGIQWNEEAIASLLQR